MRIPHVHILESGVSCLCYLLILVGQHSSVSSNQSNLSMAQNATPQDNVFMKKGYVPIFEHTPKQIPHCLMGLLVERQFAEGNRGVSYGVTEAPKNSWQRHIRQETVSGFVEIGIQNFNCTSGFLVKFRNLSGHTVESRLKPL